MAPRTGEHPVGGRPGQRRPGHSCSPPRRRFGGPSPSPCWSEDVDGVAEPAREIPSTPTSISRHDLRPVLHGRRSTVPGRRPGRHRGRHRRGPARAPQHRCHRPTPPCQRWTHQGAQSGTGVEEPDESPGLRAKGRRRRAPKPTMSSTDSIQCGCWPTAAQAAASWRVPAWWGAGGCREHPSRVTSARNHTRGRRSCPAGRGRCRRRAGGGSRKTATPLALSSPGEVRTDAEAGATSSPSRCSDSLSSPRRRTPG